MSNDSSKSPCALCGQAVEIKGFELNTETEILPFCCAGCLSIYQLLNNIEDSGVSDNEHPDYQSSKSRKEVY